MLGLSKVPVDMHVLLRSSEIIWVLLFAYLIQREKQTWLTIAVAVGMIAGTVMLGLELASQGVCICGLCWHIDVVLRAESWCWRVYHSYHIHICTSVAVRVPEEGM